jgi:hypothetical protein
MFVDLAFPVDSAHKHFYDVGPINPTGDFKNYKVSSTSTVFMSGSLRVYINGSRLGETESIYVPGRLPTDDFTLNKFTAIPSAGTFVLDNAITTDDVIRVDFDTSYV